MSSSANCLRRTKLLLCAKDKTSPENHEIDSRELRENGAGGQLPRWSSERGIRGPDRVDWPHDRQCFTSNFNYRRDVAFDISRASEATKHDGFLSENTQSSLSSKANLTVPLVQRFVREWRTRGQRHRRRRRKKYICFGPLLLSFLLFYVFTFNSTFFSIFPFFSAALLFLFGFEVKVPRQGP